MEYFGWRINKWNKLLRFKKKKKINWKWNKFCKYLSGYYIFLELELNK